MTGATGPALFLAQSGANAADLNFSAGSIWVLNGVLGLVMFGVALDIRVDEVRAAVARPLAPAIGLVAQFLLLPAVTFALTQLIDPEPSIKLGMLLVAACPGGNMSNFLAHLARGNTMLSIGMTAISTLAAVIMVPLNFGFWGARDPETAAILRDVAVGPFDLVVTILLLLALPVAAGIAVQQRRPDLAARLYPPMKRFSIVAFALFIVVALASNWQNFLDYIGLVAIAVVIHNATALGLGYLSSTALSIRGRDRRAITIEVGIQNSALGLALIFTFFDGMGGMALVAAAWGIWHLVSGLSLAWWWSRRPTGDEPAPPVGAELAAP